MGLHWCVILCFLLFTTHEGLCAAESKSTFRAAVFDKAPTSEYRNSSIPSRDEALKMVEPNLRLYLEQATNAKQQVRAADVH